MRARFTGSFARRVAAALVATIATGALGAAASAAPSTVLDNPSHNLAPPALLESTGPCTKDATGSWQCQSPCAPHLHFGYNDSTGCRALALGGLNRGRASESLPQLTPPSNYGHLSVPEQVFVLVNLERISRHVPPLVGLAQPLDAAASRAVALGEDVAPQASYGSIKATAMGATWAGGLPNAAAALFGWMYDDGWSGPSNTSNADCTGPNAPGCWGHRKVLLGAGTGTSCATCIAGAAFSSANNAVHAPSYGLVIVLPRSPDVSLVFSWNRDVVPYLPRSERIFAR